MRSTSLLHLITAALLMSGGLLTAQDGENDAVVFEQFLKAFDSLLARAQEAGLISALCFSLKPTAERWLLGPGSGVKPKGHPKD